MAYNGKKFDFEVIRGDLMRYDLKVIFFYLNFKF